MAARLIAFSGSVVLLALALPPRAGDARAAEPVPQAKAAATGAVAAKAQDADGLRPGPVTLGLDIMARAGTATGFSLSDLAFTPGNDESQIVVRVRPALSFHPSGFFRARLEGQWYAAWDERDFSRFSVYQGFVEAALPGIEAVVARAGRQEFAYGSAFMLGADAFYDGLSFDAVKVSVTPSEALSVDAFGGRHVTQDSGGIEGTLYGVYAAYALRKSASVDLYGVRDTGSAGATHAGGGRERTYSLGARLCARLAGTVDVEVEPVWQFGRTSPGPTAHDDIRAVGGHADITIQPRIGGRPGRILLSYAYGSGDGDPADGTFREFRNPGNDTPLIGAMAVVGDMSGLEAGGARASGLRILSAAAGIDVADRLNVTLDGHLFRAVRAPAGVSRDIGLETDLVVTYRVRQDLSVLVSADRFFTGRFFEDAAGSGRDIGYYYLQVQAGL